ncbi:MAG: formylglycine-generating enzyme family protein [Spirochaetes bacterium]|nr:formylglycine-generating enzyme family protein [Spirochaetota bacterium]
MVKNHGLNSGLYLIETVDIPSGTFTMGSPESEKGSFPRERPQRPVTVSAFRMGKFPVTQAQWIEVMGENPVLFDSVHFGRHRPVVQVSWFDAIVFANRLSVKGGLTPAYRINGSPNPDDWGSPPTAASSPNIDHWNAVEMTPGSSGWRLPTEAQWERAARADTVAAFSNGAENWEDNTSVGGISWFSLNSEDRTRDVGTKAANPWGLHDMHGNVFEWVWDWFADYPPYAQTNPTGPDSGAVRVIRGGSWQHSAFFARSADRLLAVPFLLNASLGLRLARP